MVSTKASTSTVWRPIFDDDEIPNLLAQSKPIQPSRLLNSSKTDSPSPGICSTPDVHQDGSEAFSPDEAIDPDIEEDSSSEYQDEAPKSSAKGRSKTRSHCRIKREASASPKPSAEKFKKVRMAGGVPPVRKKVCAEGDSDDEIIWDMKQKGYRDKPICEYLIANERTRYDVKTIATRYARIKKAKTAAAEKRLESDFEDYLQADDDALRAAVGESEARLQRDIHDAEERHWTAVIESMNAKLPAPKFTKRLAKERWTALQAGTAVVPLEEDPNPEARTARIRKEKADRRGAKQQEKLHAQDKEAQKEATAAEVARSKADAKAALQQQRNAQKAALDAKRANNQAKAEAAAEARRATIAARADAKINQMLQRQRQKQEREDKKAAAAWQKKLQSAELRQRKQEQKLLEAQRVADERAAVIREEIEETKRKELIRRHMRLAGACIAAPLVDFPTAAAVETAVIGTQVNEASNRRTVRSDSDDEFVPGAAATSRRQKAKGTSSKTATTKSSTKQPAPNQVEAGGARAANKRIKLTGATEHDVVLADDAQEQEDE